MKAVEPDPVVYGVPYVVDWTLAVIDNAFVPTVKVFEEPAEKINPDLVKFGVKVKVYAPADKLEFKAIFKATVPVTPVIPGE